MMKKYVSLVALLATNSVMAGATHTSYDLRGFYAGLGSGFTTFFNDDAHSITLTNPALYEPGHFKSTDSAVLFDGHLGFGQFIKKDTYLGAKTSVYYTPLEHLSSPQLVASANNITTTAKNTSQTTLKPIYNVNAILGYEIYPHLLPFVEGGVSFSNVKTSAQQTNTRTNLNSGSSYKYTLPLNSDGYKTGYNVGLGANYQMSKNWFLSSELIYNYLGKHSSSATITLPADAGTQNSANNRTFQMISMLASVSYLLPVY